MKSVTKYRIVEHREYSTVTKEDHIYYTIEKHHDIFIFSWWETMTKIGYNCVGDMIPVAIIYKSFDKANARLIAAAPDLLNSLNNLLNRYVEIIESGDAGFWDPETEEEVVNARKAIKKATEK